MDRCLKRFFIFGCVLASLLVCYAAFTVSDSVDNISASGEGVRWTPQSGGVSSVDITGQGVGCTLCPGKAEALRSEGMLHFADPLHALAFAAIHFSLSVNLDVCQNDWKCLKPCVCLLLSDMTNFKPCSPLPFVASDGGGESRCIDYYVYALRRIMC